MQKDSCNPCILYMAWLIPWHRGGGLLTLIAALYQPSTPLPVLGFMVLYLVPSVALHAPLHLG